jgi:hypothetical protein
MITYEDRQGRIAYRDRPQIGYPFFDPSWLVPFVDQCLLVLAKRNPPLLLEQAQSIKLELIDAQHHAKRQAPIKYLDRDWATDDDTVKVMAMFLSGSSADEVSWHAIAAEQPLPLARYQLVDLSQDIADRNLRLFQTRQRLAAAIYAKKSIEEVIAVNLVEHW